MKKITVFILIITLLSTLFSCAPAFEDAASSANEDDDQLKRVIGESDYFDSTDIKEIMNEAVRLWEEDERYAGVILTKIEYDEQWYKWEIHDLLYKEKTKDMTIEELETVGITDEEIAAHIESMTQNEIVFLSFQVSFIATDNADLSFSRDFEYDGYHLTMKKVDGQWTISGMGI